MGNNVELIVNELGINNQPTSNISVSSDGENDHVGNRPDRNVYLSQKKTYFASGNSNPLQSTIFSTNSPGPQLQTLKFVQCQLKDPVLSEIAK